MPKPKLQNVNESSGTLITALYIIIKKCWLMKVLYNAHELHRYIDV